MDLPDTICPLPAGSTAGVPSRAWLSSANSTQLVPGRGRVKSAEEIMNILEAYDLTGSLRDAAELAGCSHHTVARYVAGRVDRFRRSSCGQHLCLIMVPPAD